MMVEARQNWNLCMGLEVMVVCCMKLESIFS